MAYAVDRRFALQGKKINFHAPFSLLHNNSPLLNPAPQWEWRILAANDKMTYGVYIARKSPPTGEKITWKRMFADSLVIEVDYKSHWMMAIPKKMKMKNNNLTKWRIFHSIRIYVMDHYSNTRDGWIVTFVSNGHWKTEARFKQTTGTSRTRSILSPLQCDNKKWDWEN